MILNYEANYSEYVNLRPPKPRPRNESPLYRAIGMHSGRTQRQDARIVGELADQTVREKLRATCFVRNAAWLRNIKEKPWREDLIANRLSQIPPRGNIREEISWQERLDPPKASEPLSPTENVA